MVDRRARGYKTEQLKMYSEKILSMRLDGLSYPQIADWLREQGIIVSNDTIRRFVDQLKK